MSRSYNDMRRRAMRSAIHHGVDPYDTLTGQGAAYLRAWERKAQREAERDALEADEWVAWLTTIVGPDADTI